MVDHYDYIFDCTPVGQGSDSMMAPTLKLFIRWPGPEIIMSVSRLTGGFLLVQYSGGVV